APPSSNHKSQIINHKSLPSPGTKISSRPFRPARLCFSLGMKLLVFAHIPPPHHGQSYMVQLMLDGFGGDCRKRRDAAAQTPYQIECYHVDARVSHNLEDIG